jgi:L-asparagine transporter-like permease
MLWYVTLIMIHLGMIFIKLSRWFPELQVWIVVRALLTLSTLPSSFITFRHYGTYIGFLARIKLLYDMDGLSS